MKINKRMVSYQNLFSSPTFPRQHACVKGIYLYLQIDV